MANTDNPNGFTAVGHLLGGCDTFKTEKCYIDSSYATRLGIGDAVDINTELDQADATGKHVSIKQAAGSDGTYVLGVIQSFEPDRDNLSRTYVPASTGG
jgi:hypothetical protein